MVKLVAKLRLLDHGILSFAHAIDDMGLRGSYSNGEEGDEEDKEMESLEDFNKRVNLLVLLSIRANPDRNRDSYKEELVYQTRKDTIAQFLTVADTTRCQNKDCLA